MFGRHRLFSLNENDGPAEGNRKAQLPTNEGITSKDHALTLRDEILIIF
jgi:hypothetical protein